MFHTHTQTDEEKAEYKVYNTYNIFLFKMKRKF